MKKYPALHSALKRKNRSFYWIVGISFATMLVSFVVMCIIFSKDEADALPLNEAIVDEKANVYSYVDVSLMTDYFATYEENDIPIDYYYFVWDEDYFYVALLDRATRAKLDDVYAYSEGTSSNEPEAVRIYGMSEKISEDLKEIIIDQINEMYGSGTLTEENFAEVCGNYLINVKKTPATIAEVPLVIFFVGGFLFMMFGVILLSYQLRSRKTMKRLSPAEQEDIEASIENERALHIPGTGIYLTDRFVINVASYLIIYRYEDILWLYIYRLKRYGTTTSIGIRVGDRQGKIRTIGLSGRKHQDDMTELLEEIARRTPDVLVGYTKENRKAFKEIVKTGGMNHGLD